MVQAISSGQEKQLSQKEKNEKLAKQIEKFEKKNKEMKHKINQGLLLLLGNKAINEIQPRDHELDDVQNMKIQLRALVQNKKIRNIKFEGDQIDSARSSSDGGEAQ